jgi:hypothetical protein
VVRRPGPGTTASATAPADRGPSTVVATGDGLVPLDAPIPDLPAPTAVEDGLGERTAPTQRRLVPRPTDDEVAAPATAAARSRSHHGLLRSELVPLLLLGGTVATAYVACLQVAERRRQRRVAGR